MTVSSDTEQEDKVDGRCPDCGNVFTLTSGGRVWWHRSPKRPGSPDKRPPCPGVGALPDGSDGPEAAPGRRLTYNVREVIHHDRPAVTYEVHTGRNGRERAFRLTIEASRHSLHDTWPLRREIAQHAGVDPDQVVPDWDGDPHRRTMRRIAPINWLVRLDPAPVDWLGPAAPGASIRTTVDLPPWGPTAGTTDRPPGADGGTG